MRRPRYLKGGVGSRQVRQSRPPACARHGGRALRPRSARRRQSRSWNERETCAISSHRGCRRACRRGCRRPRGNRRTSRRRRGRLRASPAPRLRPAPAEGYPPPPHAPPHPHRHRRLPRAPRAGLEYVDKSHLDPRGPRRGRAGRPPAPPAALRQDAEPVDAPLLLREARRGPLAALRRPVDLAGGRRLPGALPALPGHLLDAQGRQAAPPSTAPGS